MLPRPCSVGRSWPSAVSSSPRSRACVNSSVMASIGTPARAANSLAGTPSVRRSAFIMNSKGSSATETSRASWMKSPRAAPSR